MYFRQKSNRTVRMLSRRLMFQVHDQHEHNASKRMLMQHGLYYFKLRRSWFLMIFIDENALNYFRF